MACLLYIIYSRRNNDLSMPLTYVVSENTKYIQHLIYSIFYARYARLEQPQNNAIPRTALRTRLKCVPFRSKLDTTTLRFESKKLNSINVRAFERSNKKIHRLRYDHHTHWAQIGNTDVAFGNHAYALNVEKPVGIVMVGLRVWFEFIERICKST